MIYSTYDPITGQFLSTISNFTDLELPDNAVPGSYNDQEHYIDLATKTVINKPSRPGPNHRWNPESKTWDLDNAQAIQSARQQRNGLLSVVDRVNPIWFASLTTAQQQELAVYRQQLLDVPGQETFPITINWPICPDWLQG